MSEKVKLGIIGIGNQGSTYARRLARENWVPDIQLVAMGPGKRVGGHRLF